MLESYRLIDPTVHEAVERDHLPRVARYAHVQDGQIVGEVRHVLYWDRLVRSLSEADWLAQRGPLPADPTPQQSAAAVAALEQTAQQDAQDAAVLRQAIRTRLDALAGKRVDDLLVADLKTLLLYLVWREGGIDKDLKVKPIGEWGR